MPIGHNGQGLMNATEECALRKPDVLCHPQEPSHPLIAHVARRYGVRRFSRTFAAV